MIVMGRKRDILNDAWVVNNGFLLFLFCFHGYGMDIMSATIRLKLRMGYEAWMDGWIQDWDMLCHVMKLFSLLACLLLTTQRISILEPVIINLFYFHSTLLRTSNSVKWTRPTQG